MSPEASANRPTQNPIVKAERSGDAVSRLKQRHHATPPGQIDDPPTSAPELAIAPVAEPLSIDSVRRAADSILMAKVDSIFAKPAERNVVQGATNMARQVKSQVLNSNTAIENYQKEKIVFEIQWHKIIASSFMCIAMFLIGAPLGAIIKRGGLGVPFLISILFFIVYYLLNMQGEKLAKQEIISPMTGIWAADIILLFVGLLFLRQARVDARLFDADAYRVFFDRIRHWYLSRKMHSKPAV